jgi:hypothetical protein
MRSLFWLLAVFAAAVALVIVGRLDAGYAVVVFPPYRIEASLLFVAITALLAFILLYVAARLLGHAVGLPATVGGGATGRTARSPPPCRPTTKAATRARRSMPRWPSRSARRPASRRCSRRVPRTRCVSSSGVTAGSLAPTPPATSCRWRGS